MSYVCAVCYVRWPCLVAEHNEFWSNKVWQPDTSQVSIPCWVMDHSECTVPVFCRCNCHAERIDEPSPTHLPLTNR